MCRLCPSRQKNVFNAFIHADKSFRIDRIAEEYNSDKKKAENYIIKKDKQRANYYNFYTNNNWGDLTNYHISINSALTGIEGAAELIKTAVMMSEKIRSQSK